MDPHVQIDEEMRRLLKATPQGSQTEVNEGSLCLPTMACLQVVDEVMPLHQLNAARGLDPWTLGSFPSDDAVREYFGEGVALYFAWLSFMFRWLLGPAVLGLVVFLLNQVFGARSCH
jgi:hypothetical protein